MRALTIGLGIATLAAGLYTVYWSAEAYFCRTHLGLKAVTLFASARGYPEWGMARMRLLLALSLIFGGAGVIALSARRDTVWTAFCLGVAALILTATVHERHTDPYTAVKLRVVGDVIRGRG